MVDKNPGSLFIRNETAFNINQSIIIFLYAFFLLYHHPQGRESFTMTNMEGFVYIFLSLLIGVPLLCAIIVISYLLHKRKLKRENEVDTDSVQSEKQVNIFAVFRQILLTPDHFFKQISGDRIDLWQAFTLLTIGGIIFTISMIISIEPFYLGSFGLIVILFITIFPITLLSLYFFWVILSVLLYVITLPFKGKGRLEITIQNSGYGIAFGLFFIDILQLVIAVLASSFNLHFIAGGGGSDPLASAVYSIFVVLSIIITLWAAILISFGLHHARNISLSHAAVIVYALVIIGIIWTYQQYLLNLIGLK